MAGARHHAGDDWVRAAEQRWGLCGVAALESDEVVGYLLLAPSFTVPSGHPLSRGPRTPDGAVLLLVALIGLRRLYRKGWRRGGHASR